MTRYSGQLSAENTAMLNQRLNKMKSLQKLSAFTGESAQKWFN